VFHTIPNVVALGGYAQLDCIGVGLRVRRSPSLDNAVTAYREICEKAEKPAQKVKCSYFIHIGEGEDERQRARERMVGYITMAGLRKTMSQGGKGGLPPTMEYFKKIGERLNDAKASDFDDNSLLYGSPQQIIDTLKRVEGLTPNWTTHPEIRKGAKPYSPGVSGSRSSPVSSSIEKANQLRPRSAALISPLISMQILVPSDETTK
jgi:hypothetical protein